MHFHNLVNHIPLLFPLAGIIVLICGLYFKSELAKRIAYLLFIVAAIGTFVSMNSGEEAEEAIEGLYPKTAHHWAHEHEERAEVFSLVMYGLGLISLIGIWASWSKNKIQKYVVYALAVFLVSALFFGFQTGKSGGQVIHKEFRK